MKIITKEEKLHMMIAKQWPSICLAQKEKLIAGSANIYGINKRVLQRTQDFFSTRLGVGKF